MINYSNLLHCWLHTPWFIPLDPRVNVYISTLPTMKVDHFPLRLSRGFPQTLNGPRASTSQVTSRIFLHFLSELDMTRQATPVSKMSIQIPWKPMVDPCRSYGYGSIPINTIFRGMNIHLPAILMFTRGTRFWHTAIFSSWKVSSLDFRQEIEELLTESISSHAGHRSSEMIKLCIDQIEAAGRWKQKPFESHDLPGVGNCPILGILDITL